MEAVVNEVFPGVAAPVIYGFKTQSVGERGVLCCNSIAHHIHLHETSQIQYNKNKNLVRHDESELALTSTEAKESPLIQSNLIQYETLQSCSTLHLKPPIAA